VSDVRLLIRFKYFRRFAFSSLTNDNFRRYALSQAISMVGNWMQIVSQSWLVLSLTGSGAMVGLVIAVQTLPTLLAAPYGGLIADRWPKDRLLIITQAVEFTALILLGSLTITGVIQIWMVIVLAALVGMSNVVYGPTQAAFVQEIVGREHVSNAVSLNAALSNSARVVGPGIAGLLIATVGVGACFLVNAASSLVVVIAIVTLDQSRLLRSPRTTRTRGQLRAALAYARAKRQIRLPLIAAAIIGGLTFEFPVTLPVFATDVLGAGASGYGLLVTAMGVGAVFGAIQLTIRPAGGVSAMTRAAAAFGVLVILLAAVQTLWVAVLISALVGSRSVRFIAIANVDLQLAAHGDMRGRIMGLWLTALAGTTAIGGPLVGVIIDLAGARVALLVGGVAAVAAAAGISLSSRGSTTS